MSRPVLLFSGQWTHLPLDELAQKLNDWGYQGVELACWGDHFEVQRALSEDDYCQQRLDLLGRHDLQILVLSNHRVSQAVCDRIEPRHRKILPDYVWGDGDPDGVSERATAEMLSTVQAARQLGVGVISGFTGSSLWPGVLGYPANNPTEVQEGMKDFVHRFTPILDACRDAGIRYALEVHPGQIAFDLYSAEMILDALDGREEFGFTFDPSHFHWQGIDPVEFLRRFADRIFHVHIKDLAMTLNGRTGVLNSYQPYGDVRRGWEFRAPGHGGLDWEAIIRTLNAINYDGALAIEWSDPAIDRDYGAEEACKFVKHLDFPQSQG
jgi:sugar phosphate isomerase/epimerase